MAAFFMDPHKISSLLQVQISLCISELRCSYLLMVKQQESKKNARDVFAAAPHFNLSVCKMKLEKTTKLHGGSVILLRKCFVFEQCRRAL